MERYDVIVVGAGLNGLVAAAYLAKAGLSVLVLERGDHIGGVLARRKLGPDFAVSHAPRSWRVPDAQILTELDLARYGLQLLTPAGSLTLLPNGDYVADYAAPHSLYRELARHSQRDADAYSRYQRDLHRQIAWISEQLAKLPSGPAIGRLPGRRWWDHWRAVLGERDADGLKMVQMLMRASAHVVESYFESSSIRVHALGSALFGTPLGPYSPGSAHMLTLREMARREPSVSWSYIRGGDGALANALADCIAAHEGKLRTSSSVASINMHRGVATGVVLEEGEEINAGIVISDLDLKQTFLSLCDWRKLPEHFVEAIAAFNAQGTLAEITLALDGLPGLASVPKDCPAIAGEIIFPGDLTQIDRAFDSWKRDEVPNHPHISVSVPSLLDPTLAPPGKHIMSILAQYVPVRPVDGPWMEENTAQFRDSILELVERHIPKLSDHILDCEIRTPLDIEAATGVAGGNPFEGDFTLDQLALNRPSPGLSGPGTPVQGLLVSSSAAFGGFALPGSAGAAAAKSALSLHQQKAGRQ